MLLLLELKQQQAILSMWLVREERRKSKVSKLRLLHDARVAGWRRYFEHTSFLMARTFFDFLS